MEDKPHFQHPQTQSSHLVSNPANDQIYSQSDSSARIQELSQKLDAYINRRINFNTDIIGLFETVTVAPAGIPVSPYDQIKISVIAGTTALNVYDSVNHVWKKVTIT